LFLFLENKEFYQTKCFFGQAPNSYAGFTMVSAKRNNTFCSFFRKKKNSIRLIASLGKALLRLLRRLRVHYGFREAEQRFLLLLEIEESYVTN
jgi:hypothetical protein